MDSTSILRAWTPTTTPKQTPFCQDSTCKGDGHSRGKGNWNGISWGSAPVGLEVDQISQSAERDQEQRSREMTEQDSGDSYRTREIKTEQRDTHIQTKKARTNDTHREREHVQPTQEPPSAKIEYLPG